MPRTRVSLTSLPFLVLLACAKPPAPPPTAIQLPAADARLSTPVSFIGSVRELSDGRVIIGDEQENRLLIADSALHSVTDLSRTGEGPGEFKSISMVWPVGHDSTLLAERNMHRAVLFDGTTSVATLSPADPRMHAFYLGHIIGSTSSALLLGSIAPINGRSMSDSAFLIRVNLRTRHIDTLNRLANGYDDSGADAGGGGGGKGKTTYVMTFGGVDFATMFNDGTVAIARGNPYRIDWCPPSGACVNGAQLESPIAVDAHEKQFYLARVAERSHQPVRDIAETSGWPATLPPFAYPSDLFDATPLFSLPDGRVLIERFISANFPERRYDIIDRTGRLAGRFTVPADTRIVGVGARALYFAVTDADGLQRLERRPIGW